MNFYVDQEKRTTVAVMTNVQSDICNYLHSLLRNRDINSYEDIYAPDILRDIICKSVPNILRVKAKCSPEDNFSEDIGVGLARARLLEKYHSHCLSILLKYAEYVYKYLDNRLLTSINMMGDKLEADKSVLLDILNGTGALD